MFSVKNVIVHRCNPSQLEIFNFSPSEDTYFYSPNGLNKPLIPDKVVKQYDGTRKFVDSPLFNSAGIARFPCEIGKKGLYHLILPEGKIIDQLILNKSEIDLSLYFSGKSLLYSFYNLTEVEILFLEIKIVDDDNGLYQKIKSSPKDLSIISAERNRLFNPDLVKNMTGGEDDPYAFYSEGDRWFFTFDGKEVRNINHMDGFDYIHTLLDNPNKPFHSLDLQRGLKGLYQEPNILAQGLLNEDNNSMSIIKDLGKDPKYDEQYIPHQKKTIKESKGMIQELENDIKIALDDGMMEEDDYIVERNNKIERFTNAISVYQDGSERNRLREQARQSVQKAIIRCAKIIRRELPELADYLRIESKYKTGKKIQTGHTCIYVPDEEILWRLFK
jgi:hypothetical protein